MPQGFSWLFLKIFPDSDVGKRFACGRTKIKKSNCEDGAHSSIMKCNPFSIMMDGSNDKPTNHASFWPKFLTLSWKMSAHFLDMPLMNIGTAEFFFNSLKSSLRKNGLDSSKTVAFMSDTTNNKKRARFGVQADQEYPLDVMLGVSAILQMSKLD